MVVVVTIYYIEQITQAQRGRHQLQVSQTEIIRYLVNPLVNLYLLIL